MRRVHTEVLVIGGGATGTGVVRDLAMRGFDAILVEKRDLTHGTTGRYHGLLHSGARYVVKDPDAAVECIQENRILRRIMPHCIEDTGGFFVVTPEDENSDYPDRFVQGCQATGIPCEEITPTQALKGEPRLNPRISRVFRVPDASIDGFQMVHATAQAARAAGARVFTYHEVVDLLTSGGEGDRVVQGARVRDLVRDEILEIEAAMVINATGAWAGVIAAMAGAQVEIVPGKGIMIATAHRLVNTVINRCKWPSDGDILVPAHTVSIIGTTDTPVAHPEDLRIEAWEVRKMLDEGEKLVPSFKQTRLLRVWAGVRPLYKETHAVDDRDISRKFALLDHQTRDGVAGFITITGGKLTTFRLMAEKAVDLAARYLGQRRPCATAETPVPGAEHGHYWLGHRLREVEDGRLQNQLVCECELVTRGMIEQALGGNPTIGLDDLRRDVRLGMGPCQGGFCTYRAVGIIHAWKQTHGLIPETEAMPWQVDGLQSPAAQPQNGPNRRISAPASDLSSHPNDLYNPNLLLRDFLQERWKGLTPILWGQQLKQEQLNRLIYLDILNADHLPDEGLKSPLTNFYHQEVFAASEEPHG